MTTAQILVVEDQVLVGENIRGKLQGLGYEVLAVAVSGEEAIQKAIAHRPDLVLMDIKLRGEMDGVATAARIQELMSVPVVYLTAYADQETLERAKATGPLGYLLKPFAAGELRTTIEMALYKHQLDRRLQESEARYRAIVEDQTELICRFEPDKTLTFVNGAYCRYFGKQPHELLGQSFLPLIYPEDQDFVGEQVASLTPQNPTVTYEHRVLTPEGELGWQRWNDRAIFDEQEHLVEYQGVGRDVTERVWAEEAYRLLVEHSLQGLVLFQNRRIVFANPVMEEITGYSVEELTAYVGDGLDRLAHPQDLEHVYQHLFALLEGREDSGYFEWRIMRKDGSVRWAEVSLAQAEYRGAPAIQITTVDITERKQAEETLHRHVTQLAVINDISNKVLAELDLDKVLHRATRLIQESFGHHHVSLFTVDRERGELVLRAAAGLYVDRVPSGYRQKLSAGLIGWTATQGETRRVNDVSAEPLYIPGYVEAFPKDERTQAELCVPIWGDEETVGVLNVESLQRGAFNEGDQLALETLADQIAIAIKNAELFDQLRAGRERLQALSRRLVDAQEAERRRIARGLHDEIGQALTVVKINLQTLQRLPEAQPLMPQLEESVGTVQRALRKVRDLSLNLRPSLLDDLGLVPALRWYVDRQARQAEFRAHFTTTLEEQALSPELEIVCFRIVQEALTNVVRHAQARQVWVELQERDGELHLIVRDDGTGFPVPKALERAAWGESMGLLGMQERAMLVMGQLELQSSPGHGTVVHASFPLRPFQLSEAEGERSEGE